MRGTVVAERRLGAREDGAASEGNSEGEGEGAERRGALVSSNRRATRKCVEASKPLLEHELAVKPLGNETSPRTFLCST